MKNPPQEKIEILSVTLLDQHRPLVTSLKRLARSLGLDFGWHYLLDLTWIINHLGPLKRKRILDAGAGTGIMQWYLADQGAEVLSVDRTSRANLALRFRTRFHARGLRDQDLTPPLQVVKNNLTAPTKVQVKVSSQVRDLAGLAKLSRSPGNVFIYNQDLKNLADIRDASMDAVVAISALEHNPSEDLTLVVTELMRVLKPGGMLLATLGAARDQDWYHDPSQGWCYTDSSLRRIFDLSPGVRSNYDQYDELCAGLRECSELRDNLARFYFQSGDNGMPWGVWDPKYQVVGVCKVKANK